MDRPPVSFEYSQRTICLADINIMVEYDTLDEQKEQLLSAYTHSKRCLLLPPYSRREVEAMESQHKFRFQPLLRFYMLEISREITQKGDCYGYDNDTDFKATLIRPTDRSRPPFQNYISEAEWAMTRLPASWPLYPPWPISCGQIPQVMGTRRLPVYLRRSRVDKWAMFSLSDTVDDTVSHLVLTRQKGEKDTLFTPVSEFYSTYNNTGCHLCLSFARTSSSIFEYLITCGDYLKKASINMKTSEGFYGHGVTLHADADFPGSHPLECPTLEIGCRYVLRQLHQEEDVDIDDEVASLLPREMGHFRRQQRYVEDEFLPAMRALRDCMRVVAATKIKAQFRLWKWRREVLWNPHTECGQLNLLIKTNSFLGSEKMSGE